MPAPTPRGTPVNEFDLTTFGGAVAYARHFADIQSRLLPERDGFLHKSPSDFVGKLGVPMLPRRKPPGLAWGVPRYCYQNVHRLVARSRRYLYAEGWAICPEVPFPVPHAWAVNAATGEAHEITLRALPAAFLGVTFTQAYSRRRWREQLKGSGDCCGPLIDAWGERWPLLRLAPAELAQVLADPPTNNHPGES